MSLPIIAIRPEPGLSQTIDRARIMKLEVQGFPLFEVRPVPWSLPDPLQFDGILLGSANAVRQGSVQLAQLLDIPVYAVGKTTADMARQAGFTVAMQGEGGLQALLDALEGRRIRFLRLAGSDRIDLVAAPGQHIVETVVYESRALPLPDMLRNMLTSGAAVMLHSARAGEHLANECSRLGIDRARISVAAMGPRIAAAAGNGWREIVVAGVPDDRALLAITENMCK